LAKGNRDLKPSNIFFLSINNIDDFENTVLTLKIGEFRLSVAATSIEIYIVAVMIMMRMKRKKKKDILFFD
jgi:hypothetical protein